MKYTKKIIFFLIFSVFSQTAFAKHLYVPKEYKQIQDAIDVAKHSDTIWVAPGKYTETLSISHDVIIFGSGADKCIIAPPPTSKGYALIMKNCDAIIDGFTVDCAGSEECVLIEDGSSRLTRMIIKNSKRHGVVLKSKKNEDIPIMKFNKIFKNKKMGILALKSTLLLKENEIYNNGAAGVSCNDSCAIVENNKIYKNDGVGVLVRENISSAKYTNPKKNVLEKRVKIINNKIISNKKGGIVCQKASPLIKENNIKVETGKPNIMLFSSNAIIKNNKLESSGPPAIMIMSGSFPQIISNHIKGTLRFPIMGKKENAFIKNNKIVSSWKSRADFLGQE